MKVPRLSVRLSSINAENFGRKQISCLILITEISEAEFSAELVAEILVVLISAEFYRSSAEISECVGCVA